MTQPITLTADIVILRRQRDDYEVLLIKRGRYPYTGCWALPGGKMDEGDSSLEATCFREAQEEVALALETLRLVGVYSQDHRDPRQRVPRAGEQAMRYVSVAYATWINEDNQPHAGDDATESAWFCVRDLPRVAFDHAVIIADAVMLVNHSRKENNE